MRGTEGFDEVRYFLRRRRQAGQVEVQPADERVGVRIGDRLHALRLHRREEVAIDGRSRPGPVLDGGRRRAHRRLISPMVATRGDVDRFGRRRFAVARVGGSHFDPANEVGHDAVGEPPLGGHLKPFVPQGGN